MPAPAPAAPQPGTFTQAFGQTFGLENNPLFNHITNHPAYQSAGQWAPYALAGAALPSALNAVGGAYRSVTGQNQQQ